MPVSLYDSLIYGPLFADKTIVDLFGDRQRIEAMVQVEVALAQAQGQLGIIPENAANAISNSSATFDPDLRAIGAGTAMAGVPVINLVEQFRTHVGDPHGQYVHWGPTSQDIIDTAHVLQLGTAIGHVEGLLKEVVITLAKLADTHRHTVMVARTRSQQALPTTFGLKATNWLAPLLRHRQRLRELKPRLLVLQFGGAAGTLAALGNKGSDTARRLARQLELGISLMPWHTQRDSFTEFASWLSLVTGSLGKIGQDIILLCQNEVAEIRESSEPGRGGSSTMPHKANPITSEMPITAARMNTSLLSNMYHAMLSENERATHSWQLEWNTLPQMLTATAAALSQVNTVLGELVVDSERMASNLAASHGLVLAEAATFALAEKIPIKEARAIVKSACKEVYKSGRHLMDLLSELGGYPIDWDYHKDPSNYLGQSDEMIDAVLDTLEK